MSSFEMDEFTIDLQPVISEAYENPDYMIKMQKLDEGASQEGSSSSGKQYIDDESPYNTLSKCWSDITNSRKSSEKSAPPGVRDVDIPPPDYSDSEGDNDDNGKSSDVKKYETVSNTPVAKRSDSPLPKFQLTLPTENRNEAMDIPPPDYGDSDDNIDSGRATSIDDAKDGSLSSGSQVQYSRTPLPTSQPTVPPRRPRKHSGVVNIPTPDYGDAEDTDDATRYKSTDRREDGMLSGASPVQHPRSPLSNSHLSPPARDPHNLGGTAHTVSMPRMYTPQPSPDPTKRDLPRSTPDLVNVGSTLSPEHRLRTPAYKGGRYASLNDETSSDPDAVVMDTERLNCNDLTELEVLSKHTINQAIQVRFKRGQIYTYIGNVLLCVNPFEYRDVYDEKHHWLYADWRGLRPFDAHVYWMASMAQRGLSESKKNQVILVSGESGAGKTEVTKHILEHLAFISKSATTDLANRLVAVNPLLEAFGNAETVMNNNSSRFGKLIEVSYLSDGTLLKASILDFLLEKSRVVSHGFGERNFHIFYYMFAGMTADQLKQYSLESVDHHRILRDGHRSKNESLRKGDAAAFRKLESIMQSLDFKEDDTTTMYSTLAAILFLTDIIITEDPDTYHLSIRDTRPLQSVADLLKLDEFTLTSVLLFSSKHIKGETIRSFRTKAGAVDARDSLAKTLYARLFGWMVKWVNTCMQPLNTEQQEGVKSISILDMSGFEVLQQNSFEQLCINAANERLQSHFVEHLIQYEQQIIVEDGLVWQNVEIPDKDQTLDILFHKSAGLFSIIDEQSYFPDASDKTLIEKFVSNHGNHDKFVTSHHHRNRDPRMFALRHYACQVWYDTRNWLTKNRDRVSQDILDCLIESENVFIRDLFTASPNARGSISTDHTRIRTNKRHGGGRVARGANQPARNQTRLEQLKKSAMPGTGARRGSNFSPNQVTMGKYFQNSLNEMLEIILKADPHFIRCFRPNCKKAANVFEYNQVMKQMSYTGIVQLAQVRSRGFAYHILISKFSRRYKVLLPSGHRVLNERETSEKILSANIIPTNADSKTFAIGNSMVFLTEATKQSLDEASQEKAVVILQAAVRYMVARKRLDELSKATLPTEIKKGSSQKAPDDPISKAPKQMVSTGVQADNVEIDAAIPSSGDEEEEGESSDSTDEELINQEEKPPWDWPMLVPREPQSPDETWGAILLKLSRFLVYIILGLAVWASATISQLSLVFLTTRYGYSKAANGHLQNALSALGEFQNTFGSLSIEEHNRTDLLSLVLILCFPRILTFLISTAKLLFSKRVSPSGKVFFASLTIDMLLTAGETVLVVRVMPSLGIVMSALILYTTACIPALCRLLFTDHSKSSPLPIHRYVARIIDLIAFLIQAGSVAYPLVMIGAKWYEWTGTDQPIPYSIYWELPVSVVLVSLRWWENFAEKDIGALKLDTLRQEIRYSRNVLSVANSFFGIVLIICLTLLLGAIHGDGDLMLFQASNWKSEMYYPLYLQVFCSALCYYWASIASKLLMQTISYSLPLALSIPTVVLVLVLSCKDIISPEETLMAADAIYYNEGFPDLCDISGMSWLSMLASLLWIGALLWIGRHIWYPQHTRLAKRDVLFVNPLYLGSLIVPSLMLNRRARDQQKGSEKSACAREDLSHMEQGSNNPNMETASESVDPADVPFIYACATMWHETDAEMKQLLKSLFRMDLDQHTRRLAQEHFKVVDREYYEFEAHIFFDNAMELGEDGQIWHANSYVKQMVSVLNEAASAIMEVEIQLPAPTRIPTPYGGQLIWTMPGRNKLVVHVKDQNKIRHKKRWSQVMYMYYLLSYNIFDEQGDELFSRLVDDCGKQPGPGPHSKSVTPLGSPTASMADGLDKENDAVPGKPKKRDPKEIMKRNQKLGTNASSGIFQQVHEKLTRKANNTFILALDGDVDFKPRAVRLLLDRMRKNIKVGGACGRIHPIGSGPVVWYQIFEYAVGHWFQKATEHVFGCVLCSPGCFSLFRASALMDDNVMKKYATVSTQATHYLQYDQGEDRWLCTLLLQQGHRIDYAAASDALTFAPEKFDEFFKQRRRWVTSTLANQLDVLSDFRNTSLANDNISYFYMLYQSFLTISTVIGPSTIVIVIASAFRVVLNCDLWVAYLLSIIPPALYIAICFLCKEKTQIAIAGLLAVLYACIMMVVLVGIIASFFINDILDPSLLFLAFVSGGFLFAGLLHPYELTCLLPGLLYYLCIPVGYLVLVIYSFSNMDNVSWGTREDPKKPSSHDIAPEPGKKKKRFFNWSLFGVDRILKEVKDFALQFFNNKESHLEREQLSVLKSISKRLKKMDKKLGGESIVDDDEEEVKYQIPEVIHPAPQLATPQVGSLSLASVKLQSKTPAPEAESEPIVDDPDNPIWLNDEVFGSRPLGRLGTKQQDFWVKFIRIYEKPLKKNREVERELKKGLISLRNNVNFAMWFMNGMWIMFNYLVVTNSDIPNIQLTKAVSVEPLSFIFLALYLGIMCLQFIGMSLHRWGVFLQLISITELQPPCRKRKNEHLENLTTEDALRVTLELQKPRGKFGNINVPDSLDSFEQMRGEPLHRALKRRLSVNLDPFGRRERRTNDSISRAALHRVRGLLPAPESEQRDIPRSGERTPRERERRPRRHGDEPRYDRQRHRHDHQPRPYPPRDQVAFVDEEGDHHRRHRRRPDEGDRYPGYRRRERGIPDDRHTPHPDERRRHRHRDRDHHAMRHHPQFGPLDREGLFKRRLQRLNSLQAGYY